MRVNRVAVEIVGVVPERFGGMDGLSRVDIFLPAAMQVRLGIYSNARIFASDDRPNDPDWNRENRVRWLEVLVRVPPAVAPGAVTVALDRAVAPDREDLLSQLQSPEEREQV